MFGLLSSLVLFTTVPLHSIILASNACDNLEVNESVSDVGGICVYSLGEYRWYYIKNGTVYGNTCTMNDAQWCNGFLTKEADIKASKSKNSNKEKI